MDQLGIGAQNHLIRLVTPSKAGWDPIEILGAIPDAMLILDDEKRRALAMNVAFIELVGRTMGELDHSGFHPLEVIHPDDHAQFQELGDPALADSGEAANLRVMTPTGSNIPVEVHARLLPCGREQRVWVFFFRAVEARMALEKELEDRIRTEKRRTVEAVKSSLRIYQLTEKVRSAPKLSTLLMDIRTEEELFRRAGEFLISEGMNYQEAAIFLLDGQTLKLCYSSSNRSHMSYDVQKSNRYARFLVEGVQPAEHENVQLVALRAKDKAIGVLEVLFDPRERALFMQNPLIVGWNNDVLETTAEILALFLENLRLYQKLRRQTVLDPLTSVYNRHYLLTHLEAEIERSNALQRTLSLIFTDVDGFKAVNDTYGHHNGDLIIQETAFLLQQSLRSLDCICRYGGDEFVVLLPDTELPIAEQRAEELRRIIEQHSFRLIEPATGGTILLNLTISAGVTTTEQGQTSHQLLQGADLALYGAKRRGKNCVYRIEHLRDPDSETLKLPARAKRLTHLIETHDEEPPAEPAPGAAS